MYPTSVKTIQTTNSNGTTGPVPFSTVSQLSKENISEFRMMETVICDSLKVEMSRRIEAIMNYKPLPENIYVNPVTLTATFVFDGLLFHLEGERMELFLVRQCAYCGTGEFRSMPLKSLADLGQAIAIWEPLHACCRSEDPACCE